MTTATTTKVLINAEVLGESLPEPFVCLHQRGGLDQSDFTDDFAEVVVANPRVDPLDCLLKVGREDNFF